MCWMKFFIEICYLLTWYTNGGKSKRDEREPMPCDEHHQTTALCHASISLVPFVAITFPTNMLSSTFLDTAPLFRYDLDFIDVCR